MAGVLAQTFGDLELIVVDLGSTDRTLDAVRAVSDRRVVVLEPDTDSSGHPSYRDVLATARGRWSTVINADVEADPAWLARIGRLADGSGAAFVSCGGRQLDSRGAVSEFRPVEAGDGTAACLRAGAFATTTDRLRAAAELIGSELDATRGHGADCDPAGHFGRVALDLALLDGDTVLHSPELLLSWHDFVADSDATARTDDELQLHLAMQGIDAQARTPIPDERLLARYATSGAMAAVRLRQGRDARRLFRIACRARPEVRDHWTRLFAAHLGPLGQRICGTPIVAE